MASGHIHTLGIPSQLSGSRGHIAWDSPLQSALLPLGESHSQTLGHPPKAQQGGQHCRVGQVVLHRSERPGSDG